ncbi:putative F-box/LRR-repeat protein At5g41840 [Arachis duranensis]|uniref:F-box/LRR-repeat protein At5g41840 n=1 Tax=Arachis duranensis TaxID=130453 RepID=A0A9C6T4D4_ARADU|nr:putative F-box/LRR-repeat protein At5g41840 [Arachis duranensis]
MDRISDLPDCILLHILSFLPTKTAFSTTVLSRRWTRLCHDLQHFEFKFNQIPVGNLEELLSHCTALETLVLDSVCRSGEEGQLSICFPSLESLHFKSYLRVALRLILVIDTPSLKRLHIQAESGFREIRVRNLHNVEEASIDIYKQSSVLEFLAELCRIRILELGLSVFDCLPEAPPHRIPEFNCLIDNI